MVSGQFSGDQPIPNKDLPGFRVCIVNSNVPNMLGQISTAMAQDQLNIVDMLNKSRGDLAYTLVDVDKPINEGLIGKLKAIDGVLAVRTI